MHIRQLFKAIILMVALTFLYSSCSDKNEQEENSNNQQAILVFMPWSGNENSSNLYQFLLNNLDSIEAGIKAQKGLKNSRLFVSIARSSKTSQLYEVVYKNGQCSHVNIKEYDSKNCATKEGIAEIINEVKRQSNALNYALIIGGHGCGWTFNTDWQQYPYKTPAKGATATEDAPSPYPFTRFFGSVNSREYAIDVTTLAQAIEMTGTKMQYILFDNCYMANVETAYELRNVTNFMIASTNEIMNIGLPYKMMWSYLASPTPNYEQIVKAFHSFYTSYKDYPYGTLSAIDCRQMDELAQLMKQINSSYSLADSLRDSIQVLCDFKPTIFYDFGDYIERLNIDATLKSQFDRQLAKVVRYSAYTPTIYSYLYPYQGPKYIKVNHFSGLTTSSPSTNRIATIGLPKTKWAQATN